MPRLLAAVAASASLSLALPPGAAGAAPAAPFQVPFPCGETWTGSTRAGHSPSAKSVDFNRNPDAGAPVRTARSRVFRGVCLLSTKSMTSTR